MPTNHGKENAASGRVPPTAACRYLTYPKGVSPIDSHRIGAASGPVRSRGIHFDDHLQLQFLQRSPPENTYSDVFSGALFHTPRGRPAPLEDRFPAASAFLICSGPSLRGQRLERLQRRGFLTCSVNNAATLIRSHLWISVDPPNHFCDGIWRDPAILKFTPMAHRSKKIYVRDDRRRLVPGIRSAEEMPNVIFYCRNEEFRPEVWLEEDAINWGNHREVADPRGNRGCRSVMLAAVRILYSLGIRTIYLLGCDFSMREGAANYAFEQDRSPASVRGNNIGYRVLNERFELLLPYFEKKGLEVYNCTEPSGLRAFPRLSLEEALDRAAGAMPEKMVTSGMYDGTDRLDRNPTPTRR